MSYMLAGISFLLFCGSDINSAGSYLIACAIFLVAGNLSGINDKLWQILHKKENEE